MNRLVGDGSTYRRPHFVHFQQTALVSACWSLISLAVFVGGEEKAMSLVCVERSENQDEVGLEGQQCWNNSNKGRW